MGLQSSERLSKHVVRLVDCTSCSTVPQNSTTKNTENLLAKHSFSVLFWDTQLIRLYEHPIYCTVVRHEFIYWYNRDKRAGNRFCLMMSFCPRSQVVFARVRETALADRSIIKRLKYLPWSYWRLIWRQNYLDMVLPLIAKSSEKFLF